MSSPELCCILGPTASGKTSYALEVARQSGASLVSADSRMVFQGLDIGTGKPTWEYRQLESSHWQPVLREEAWGPVYEIEGLEHHLLDVVPPEHAWTLADWLKAARQVIATAKKRDRAVIIVGGTGLYIKALLDGYQLPPTDPGVRREIDQLTDDQLRLALGAVDPVSAQREVGNRRRLVRALEIYRLTGQPASVARLAGGFPDAEVRILERPQADLVSRIDARILERLNEGMVEEVVTLLDRGVSSDWLRSLGLEYRVITDWLAEGNRRQQDELIARLQTEIHGYARRQRTYLRTQFAHLPVVKQIKV